MKKDYLLILGVCTDELVFYEHRCSDQKREW